MSARAAETTQGRPNLELKRVHVRGLRGLERLTLPEDGLGWGREGLPGVLVLAGPNGSGKTTLLRCLAQMAHTLLAPPATIPDEVDALECLVDFSIQDGAQPAEEVRFLVGDEAFVSAHETACCFGYVRTKGRPRSIQRGGVVALRQTLRVPARFSTSAWPRVAFFPAEERDLVVPEINYKAPGHLDDEGGFAERWERPGLKQWSGSTLELLFSARWADLNAVAAGHPEAATRFDRYVRAFHDLTGGQKRLGWTAKGELVVQLKGGGSHGLEELSAGERQALLLLAELRRVWRPGSLILIDEVELHLHDRWQARLLDLLHEMRRELGGQVIVTTQSHWLFEIAGLEARALLGQERLR